MPLLSEYSNYGDWDTDAARRGTMLYNRPVMLGIDYFVKKANGRETSKIDFEAGGFLKNKAKSEIEENEKWILSGELYDPIGYGWMFTVFKGPIPRTGRSAYSANRETIGRDGKGNNSRIGIRSAKSGRRLRLDM